MAAGYKKTFIRSGRDEGPVVIAISNDYWLSLLALQQPSQAGLEPPAGQAASEEPLAPPLFRLSVT